ncbi:MULTISPECIES: transposase [unclassified Microcoleus]|nr:MULTISPECIES: transposase [unclassified Microcoleus]
MTQRAFKYRFYPTSEQESLLRQTVGGPRLVYNCAVATTTEAGCDRQERVRYVETNVMLAQSKKQEDLRFLTEVSNVPLQQGWQHLQTAFTNFFAGRAKYPNFKKQQNGGTAEYTKATFRLKDSQVFLPKFSEPLNIYGIREISSCVEQSTVTVNFSPPGRWTVSLLVDVDLEPSPASSNQIEIDLDITNLITLSTGAKFGNSKTFQAKNRKLCRVQKALNYQQKAPNNRYKDSLKVAVSTRERT